MRSREKKRLISGITALVLLILPGCFWVKEDAARKAVGGRANLMVASEGRAASEKTDIVVAGFFLADCQADFKLGRRQVAERYRRQLRTVFAGIIKTVANDGALSGQGSLVVRALYRHTWDAAPVNSRMNSESLTGRRVSYYGAPKDEEARSRQTAIDPLSPPAQFKTDFQLIAYEVAIPLGLLYRLGGNLTEKNIINSWTVRKDLLYAVAAIAIKENKENRRE